jgi:uncharacterized protein YecE (DUF72 family)
MLVGCCGTAGKSLKIYSEFFKAVEIQSTFYRLPKRSTAARWRTQVPENFVFTMKVFQGITHPSNSPTWRKYRKLIEDVEPSSVGVLQDTEYVIKSWEETISIARELRAEIVVVQLPPSFALSNENMERIKKLPFHEIKIAIEFRHKSWIESIGKVLDTIKRKGGVVVWDPLKYGELKQELNYYRLHGIDGFTNYGYVYSEMDLKKLKTFCKEKEGYVFFNNVKMWDNALSFIKILNES